MIQHEVDRCQMDGNFWSDLRSGRTIFQDRVDRRSTVKKVEMRSSALLHFPSLPILRGAPGSVGSSLFWGSPFFWDWFMRVHARVCCSESIGRSRSRLF